MKSRSQYFTGAALLLAIAIPGAASAQHGHGQRDSTQAQDSSKMMGQGMMGGHMGEGMMSMMGGGNMMMGMGGMTMREAMRLQPGQVLKHADDLGLGSEQRNRLESLGQDRRSAHQAWMEAMKDANHELWDLFRSEKVDSDALREAAEKAFTPHLEMHLRMLTDAVAVREILTPEQLEKVRGGGGNMMMNKGG